MRIIALSDWRVQDIEQFIDYLEELKEKPDVIVYAGDDLDRFIEIDEIETKNNINKFEKIANYSKHGLCAVAGNDDPPYYKNIIKGKNVYDIHDNPFIIDNFALIGIEGAVSKIGPLLLTEKEVKTHLQTMVNRVGNKQLIIVSHSPPFKILDFAMRFGRAHIGSTSLRKFIDKYTNKIKLVISGHVHLQGGKSEKFKDTLVVNCASHDFPGSAGKVAIIDISPDKVDIKWKTHYGLSDVPFVAKKRAKVLKENGVSNMKQLAALSFDDPLSKKIEPFPLIVTYAKAIISEKMIVKRGIKSAFDNIENGNIYFFDAEYNAATTRSGPYGLFLLGWMNTNGKMQQIFLDRPQDEMKKLKEFSEWVEREKPLFIAYGSKTADVPHLRNCFSRFGMPFKSIENSFFDLYGDLLYTQSYKKQRYYLPIPTPCGLKDVSKFLGYPASELNLSSGIEAPFEYEKFLRKRKKTSKEKIKNDLLSYNQDDLKRTKFIYDFLKKKD